MHELGAWPCLVRFKVCRADGQSGRVIGRDVGIDDADTGNIERAVEDGIILGVATGTDVRLRALKVPQVVEQVVGEGVRDRNISGKVRKGG